MNDLRDLKHSINNDIQNILSLLKHIKNDVQIEDEDISMMLDGVIEREEPLIDKIKQFTELKE